MPIVRQVTGPSAKGRNPAGLMNGGRTIANPRRLNLRLETVRSVAPHVITFVCAHSFSRLGAPCATAMARPPHAGADIPARRARGWA